MGVILAGVIATILGGAVFAAVLTALGVAVYHETSRMTPVIGLGVHLHTAGYVVVVVCGALALASREPWSVIASVALCALVPMVTVLRSAPGADAVLTMLGTGWVTLYVGLCVHAGIALRLEVGSLDQAWAADLGERFTPSGDSMALGLAWTAAAILATWLADTSALFVGRSVGRTPLIPLVSPKKTLEGAGGSVLGAVVGVVLVTVAFGIPDVTIPLAIAVGVLLGGVGIAGDLLESFLKRSAGVKDSGSLIPGHGGIFDRVDGLLPTLLVTWIAVLAIH